MSQTHMSQTWPTTSEHATRQSLLVKASQLHGVQMVSHAASLTPQCPTPPTVCARYTERCSHTTPIIAARVHIQTQPHAYMPYANSLSMTTHLVQSAYMQHAIPLSRTAYLQYFFTPWLPRSWTQSQQCSRSSGPLPLAVAPNALNT